MDRAQTLIADSYHRKTLHALHRLPYASHAHPGPGYCTAPPLNSEGGITENTSNVTTTVLRLTLVDAREYKTPSVNGRVQIVTSPELTGHVAGIRIWGVMKYFVVIHSPGYDNSIAPNGAHSHWH